MAIHYSMLCYMNCVYTYISLYYIYIEREIYAYMHIVCVYIYIERDMIYLSISISIYIYIYICTHIHMYAWMYASNYSCMSYSSKLRSLAHAPRAARAGEQHPRELLDHGLYKPLTSEGGRLHMAHFQFHWAHSNWARF